MKFIVEKGGKTPPGITVTARADGAFVVDIDPIVAHKLGGSKAQLTALRRERATTREEGAKERRALTEQLMHVTMSLSAFLEAHDWLLHSPTSGLTDDGRERIRAFFLAVTPAARSAVARGTDALIDWNEVVTGRTYEGTYDGPSIWATIAAEVRPAVNGPEGAAFLQYVEQRIADDAEDREAGIAPPVDWLHATFAFAAEGAAACRGIMLTDPERGEWSSSLYRGFIAVALNAARQLALRQLPSEPEPAIEPLPEPEPRPEGGLVLVPRVLDRATGPGTDGASDAPDAEAQE